MHYYFQELYLKKQNKYTSIFDYIGLFLNLKHCITKADHKLKDILVIHAILHSFPCFNIQDIVKQNLFDKEKDLTLDILTMELISIYKYSECNCLANKKNKKAKFDQIALFTKSLLSSNDSRKKKKKVKNLDKGKKSQTQPAGTKCYICGQEGHWALEYTSKTNKNSFQPRGSTNLAIEQL